MANRRSITMTDRQWLRLSGEIAKLRPAPLILKYLQERITMSFDSTAPSDEDMDAIEKAEVLADH